jgi:uncharacterized membrane protein
MRWITLLALVPFVALAFQAHPKMSKPAPVAKPTFDKAVKSFVTKYCLSCHTGSKAADGVDLSKVKTADDAQKMARIMRKSVREVNEKSMPPADAKPKPTAAERKSFADWVGTLKQ